MSVILLHRVENMPPKDIKIQLLNNTQFNSLKINLVEPILLHRCIKIFINEFITCRKCGNFPEKYVSPMSQMENDHLTEFHLTESVDRKFLII
jgi:hypothetical protein